jgi:hypothetical protein
MTPTAKPLRRKRKRFDLRTVTLVTVVTLLVWLLAESRTVRTRVAELALRAEVGSGSGLAVRPETGTAWPDAVKVTFSGSTAGLDQVLRSLQGRLPLRIGIEVPASPGVHEMDLRETLRTSELLLNAGVSVLEISPERVSVEVDAIRTMSLPVRVLPPDGVAFEPTGSPQARPSTLRVRGPGSVLARLEGDEGLIRLDPGAIATLTPGALETIPRLRVELPEDPDRWQTVFEPEYVDVSLALRSRMQSLTLRAMPVQVLLAPGEVGRWRVALQPGAQDLVGIEVTGPSDQIERLRSGDVVPTAVISLDFDELERGVDTKRAQILGLPPGVQVGADADLGVRLSIVRVTPDPVPE